MKKLVSMLISISMIFAMLPTFVIAEEGTLPTYNSNANFSTSAGDGTWDNGIWRAEYWHPDWCNYVKMTAVHQGGEYTDNQWDWSGEAIRVNGTNIITSNSSNTKNGVRAFIAPFKGTVTIKESTIINRSENGIYVRITQSASDNQGLKVIWGSGSWHNNSTYTIIYGWNTSNQEAVTDIAVEKGDIIRFEAVSADTGNDGTADWTNEIIYTAIEPEVTPEIAIDYENEKLTGFGEGNYTIDDTAVTPDNGSLAIAEYMGKTIAIVKKGVIEAADSQAQSLTVPARPTAPVVSAVDETSVGANNGKITGVTDAMEYKLSSAQEWTPVGSGLTELTNLAPGSYNVRYKATSSSFVSLSETVAINAQGVQEPIVTVPTLADTVYTDGMKLLNISLEGIQIPSGNTLGAFTWKTPNMLVNSGDNQSFDAVFTPTDTNNFKIKDLQIPVNIKPAAITGITVTGYDGKANGTVHSVTVTGTRAGDTVMYKVDSGEFTADAPSYTEVCEHSVTVKVSRANYNDFTQEVKIKITAVPTPEPTLEPTSEPTASPTTEPTTEPTQTTYISNEKFNTSTADGKWDGGIWSAMCYVQDWWTYSSLTQVTDGKYNLGWLKNGLARVDGSTLETDTITDNFTARAFTVPKDGIIRIEKTEITNKSASASKFQIRSKQNDSTDLNTLLRSSEIKANGKAEQAAIELSVKAGDIIYFEAATASAGTGVTVEWINTLKYIDEFTPVPTPNPDRMVFGSNDAFSTDSGNGAWDYVWSAMMCDENGDYQLITDKITVSPEKNDVSGGYGHSDDTDHYPIVNGHQLVDPNLPIETVDKEHSRSPVRVFTAPKAGTVKIASAEIQDYSGQNKTARIIKQTTGGNSVLWENDIAGWSSISNPALTFEMAAGDKIYFEVKRKGTNNWNYGNVSWTTTVTYTDPDATPSPSAEPTTNPTSEPTAAPSAQPTSEPTAAPSAQPTSEPTAAPSAQPTSEPTAAPSAQPTSEPTQTTYISNEKFNTSTADGKWDGGIWSAMCYVQDWWTYSSLTEVTDGKYNLSWLENGLARVDGNTLETDTTIKNFTVRAFTAPQKGILRIEKATITNASAAAAKVQIRHKANNGDLKHIWKTGATEIAGNGTTEQEQIELQVNEGDIIYFEAASASEGTGVTVEWINKLTYIDEFTPEPTPTPTPIPTPEPTPDFNKTLYRASDSWSMEENGDNVWKWQSYNVTSKTYEDLTKTMESNLSMGDDWSDGPVWLAGDDWRWSAVGKYTMRATVDPGDPTTEETSGDFKVHRDYPVRTFTSPKNGTVSIQASNNKIWAKDESTGTHIRIMCQRADGSKPIQIFPNADKTDWLNIKGEYNFEPIEFELNAGDKLMFENAFIWKEGGYSPWNTYVQWDPIVEYKTISPKLTGVIPADGAENIALNAEHILNYDGALADISADKLTVYEVNSEGENIKSDAVCSSIAVDGASVKFVLDGLKPYTKYEAKLDGICYFGFDAKNEKSETITFTTGSAVNIGEAKYENGKVSVPVNNPYKENKTATLIAAVCKGTESKYSIEKTYYITRRDIGANDVIETEAELPSGSDYFIKIVVMEDMQKARAYAPASIIRR